MQAKAGEINIGRFFRLVQDGQKPLNLIGEVGPHFAAVAFLVEQFQPFMAETHDHVQL